MTEFEITPDTCPFHSNGNICDLKRYNSIVGKQYEDKSCDDDCPACNGITLTRHIQKQEPVGFARGHL